jgi:hypothetical protein
MIETRQTPPATSPGRVGATHAAATLSVEDVGRVPAQQAAASVDLRVASLDAAPRAARRFASYHGLARVHGGAAWLVQSLLARSGEHHSPIGATSHHSAGGPPQMPERELRLLALECAAWFAAGRRGLSSGFTMRTTVHSPSREAAIQLASEPDACLRLASAIASSRVIRMPPLL